MIGINRAILFAFVFSFLLGCQSKGTPVDHIQERISKDSRYRRLNEFCANLQVVKKSEIVSQRLFRNKVGISYGLRSDLSEAQVIGSIRDEISSSNTEWKPIESSYVYEWENAKENISLTAQYRFTSGDIDFALSCSMRK